MRCCAGVVAACAVRGTSKSSSCGSAGEVLASRVFLFKLLLSVSHCTWGSHGVMLACGTVCNVRASPHAPGTRFVATSTTLLVSSGGYCSKSAFAAPECAGWAAVMLIPTVVVLSVVPSTVSTFVLVTNVEDMANTDVARQVVHTQYLTHALQALRMYAAQCAVRPFACCGRMC